MDQQTKAKAGLAALLPIVFLLIAYIPPTMWRQYLAVPVPFIVIALAHPLAHLRTATDKKTNGKQRPTASYLVGAAALLALLAYPVVWGHSTALLTPGKWTPILLHKTSADIADKIREPRLVCTLGPLQALEGGCDVYPELACGAIVYRVADRMSDEQRQATHSVGPATLNALLKERPPAAVIVGIEPSYFSFLEDPLRQAAPSGWSREVYDSGLQVYVRP
jgi:hypothetical protein